jgi:hypothetical protein
VREVIVEMWCALRHATICHRFHHGKAGALDCENADDLPEAVFDPLLAMGVMRRRRF